MTPDGDLETEREKLRAAYIAGITAYQRISPDLAERSFENWLARQVSEVDVLGLHDHDDTPPNVVSLRSRRQS